MNRIFSNIRAGFRLFRVAFVMFGWTILAGCGLLFTGKDAHRRYRWRCWIMKHQARAVLSACGVAWTVEGTPPAAPFMLIANHLGYLDIVLMCATTPAWFISKSEVAGWPGIGTVVKSVNTLFVNRESKADLVRLSQLVHEKLDRGEGVIFYPEGTSSAGAEILPFKPALLEPAASRELPVHWAVIHYATPPGGPPAHIAVCWWGDMDFFPHFLGLLRLSGTQARIRFGSAPQHHPDRKVLANRLREAMLTSFTKVTPEET